MRSTGCLVRVSAGRIRAGEPGDCFRCAVALALQAATGDDHANVYEDDWRLWIEVHSRHIPAPDDVRRFVDNFDGGAVLRPFSFRLPPFTDPEWRERCGLCGCAFAAAELDDNGWCVGCR